MISITAQQAAEIVGGELVNLSPDAVISAPAEFDSRKCGSGSLFLALPGARVDGHDFIGTAIECGATAALAARDTGYPAIVVKPLGKQESNADAFAHDPDGSGAAVLDGLGKMARHVVDSLEPQGLTVVGVTGSAGKTSTKDMMATLLRTAGPTVAPKGSFNNEIGHPYTVLQADEDTKFLVAEMSARGVGHVAHLAEVAPPKIGAVLNVGTAHLGEFGSREVIAQAKGELVESLPAAEQGGVAVLNADDEFVIAMAPRTKAKVVTFAVQPADGTSNAACNGADYAAIDVSVDDSARASFTLRVPGGECFPVHLQVFGAHQVPNSLAAAAVAIEAGLAPEVVAEALSNHRAVSERRMDVTTRTDGVTIINDSYNANPDSMRAGIDALARTAEARRRNSTEAPSAWAVLGQMGELGDSAVEEHNRLAQYVVDAGVDKLIAVGNGFNARALATKAEALGLNTKRVDTTDEAVSEIVDKVQPGDVILVKASYADHLWDVADALVENDSEVKKEK